VASIIYVAVLVAGGYFHLAGLVPATPARTAGFFALMLTLLGLETAEWLRYRGGTPRTVAVTLLAARSLLYVAVSTLDLSGFSRALFLLIPFGAYFTLGRRVSTAVAAALLGVLLLRLPGDWYRDEEALSDLLMFVIGLVFAVSMAAVAAQAQAYAARTREYAAEVERLATVAERNRLARDLHDSLGHHLTAASVQLEKAQRTSTGTRRPQRRP
jgi:signal transduction histidine kinase